MKLKTYLRELKRESIHCANTTLDIVEFRNHKELLEEWKKMVARATQTIYASEPLFKDVKVGEELKL